MTWLDLYNFLHTNAHDLNNLDQAFWSEEVEVYDCKTVEIILVTYEFTMKNGRKTFLSMNLNCLSEDVDRQKLFVKI